MRMKSVLFLLGATALAAAFLFAWFIGACSREMTSPPGRPLPDEPSAPPALADLDVRGTGAGSRSGGPAAESAHRSLLVVVIDPEGRRCPEAEISIDFRALDGAAIVPESRRAEPAGQKYGLVVPGSLEILRYDAVVSLDGHRPAHFDGEVHIASVSVLRLRVVQELTIGVHCIPVHGEASVAGTTVYAVDKSGDLVSRSDVDAFGVAHLRVDLASLDFLVAFAPDGRSAYEGDLHSLRASWLGSSCPESCSLLMRPPRRVRVLRGESVSFAVRSARGSALLEQSIVSRDIDATESVVEGLVASCEYTIEQSIGGQEYLRTITISPNAAQHDVVELQSGEASEFVAAPRFDFVLPGRDGVPGGEITAWVSDRSLGRVPSGPHDVESELSGALIPRTSTIAVVYESASHIAVRMVRDVASTEAASTVLFTLREQDETWSVSGDVCGEILDHGRERRSSPEIFAVGTRWGFTRLVATEVGVDGSFEFAGLFGDPVDVYASLANGVVHRRVERDAPERGGLDLCEGDIEFELMPPRIAALIRERADRRVDSLTVRARGPVMEGVDPPSRPPEASPRFCCRLLSEAGAPLADVAMAIRDTSEDGAFKDGAFEFARTDACGMAYWDAAADPAAVEVGVLGGPRSSGFSELRDGDSSTARVYACTLRRSRHDFYRASRVRVTDEAGLLQGWRRVEVSFPGDATRPRFAAATDANGLLHFVMLHPTRVRVRSLRAGGNGVVMAPQTVASGTAEAVLPRDR